MTVKHIALVGCGNWGKHILRDLKTLGAHVTVVAISDATITRARDGGADAIVGRIASLPQDLDGAVVATSTDAHAEAVLALAAWNVPIFVEKPLAASVEEARRILRAAGNRVFVMHKWRYHPGIECLREIVAEGRLGAPIGLRSVRVGWSMTHDDVDPIWTLLPHDLSIVLHVFGSIPMPREAFADPLGPLGGGLFTRLGGSGQPDVVIEVSAYHPLFRRSIILACEDGVAQLGDSYDEEVVLRIGAPGSRSAIEKRLTAKGPMPLLRELEVFLGYLDGGPPPFSTAAEGCSVIETIAALRRMAGLPE